MWYMTPQRKLLQKIVKEFAEREIRPFIPRLEAGVYPVAIIKKLGEIGVLGLCHDMQYGGHGVDYTNWYLALEEISKVSSTVALLAAQTSELCAHFCEHVCTSAQIEKYIKPAVRGEIILGQFATEPCGMASLADFETTAVRDAEGWVINGGKIFATNAGVCDYAMVICKTSDHPEPGTMRGASMFMVPKGAPGYTIGHIENKLGCHGTNTAQVYFDNCRLPVDALIGKVDECLPVLMERFNPGLGLYGALNLGAAQAVYEKTRAFLSARLQNGLSLWDTHQVIRNHMSKMWMRLAVFRQALYGYAQMQSEGMEVTDLAISLKVEGAELAKSVCDQCITLHGGLGTVKETGLERYYRDVKMFDITCGSNLTLVDVLSKSL